GTANGMLKVMAKMGISTLQSYKGAQIFEAVGIGEEVINRCFAGTASRIKGVGFDMLGEEACRRHVLGYPQPAREVWQGKSVPPNDGQFHWRGEGEKHAMDPNFIHDLQVAARTDSREAYRRFSARANFDASERCTLRGLLRFKGIVNQPAGLEGEGHGAIGIDEVEPAAEIVKRFRTGAMSFGSISRETHETLAIAMNRIHGKSNTGEGGEHSDRFNPEASGDSRRSAIKQ